MGIKRHFVYCQLLFGWFILNAAAFWAVFTPAFAHMLDLGDALTERREKFVVFGLWVLAEVIVFFVLLVTATVLLCACRDLPSSAP